MDELKVVKVKPWGEGQGDFVLINEKDFDPAVHVLLSEKPPAPPPAPRKKGS